MTDDLPSPHRYVRLLARSQPSTFQVSLACVFPSCFRSSSLPFPRNIHSQHFPQYVFFIFISPHHMPVPVHSSLGDIVLEACATLVVPRMFSFLVLSFFGCHSAHPFTPHIHRSILISLAAGRASGYKNSSQIHMYCWIRWLLRLAFYLTLYDTAPVHIFLYCK